MASSSDAHLQRLVRYAETVMAIKFHQFGNIWGNLEQTVKDQNIQ